MKGYICSPSFPREIALRKITKAIFSIPKLATPIAKTEVNPAATPRHPIKLPGFKVLKY